MKVRSIMMVSVVMAAMLTVLQGETSPVPQLPPPVYARTSLLRLLANPEQFDGKRIRVSGYFHFLFEDCGLYFSKTDADYLSENAIWVSGFVTGHRQLLVGPPSRPKPIAYFHGKYVTLTGTFDASGHGHMGAYAGTLRDIDYVEEERRWYDGAVELDDNGKPVKAKK